MILQKITLENFLQFHGRQEITFATGGEKNITLIHAENGFGKTNLLNALLWGFYGHDGLKKPEALTEGLIHTHAARSAHEPGDLVAKVTILFEDDEGQYTLTRSLSLAQHQIDSSKTDLELWVRRADGNTVQMFPREPRLRQQWIDALMPAAIAPYLFFDGENMDHLAMEENSGEVAEAIRRMLGLSLLKKTVEDLNCDSVRGKLTKELRERTNETTAILLDEEAAIQAKLGELATSLENCHKEQLAVAEEIRISNAKLEANQKTRDRQQQRDRLETEQSTLQQDLGGLDKRISNLIAEDGFVMFAGDLADKGREITSRLRAEGRIPAPVTDAFVKELLASGRCICGTALEEGGEHYKEVSQLLARAGDEGFNNAVAALERAIASIETARPRTIQSFRELAEARVARKTRLRQIAEELIGIHDKLSGRDDEEVAKLEAHREALCLKERELLAEQAVLEHKLAERRLDLDEVRRKISASRQDEEHAARTQRRLDLLDETAALLQTILDAETKELRTHLQDEINRHFREIIDRDYWVELTPDFKLRLRKNITIKGNSIESDVATSKGQRQLTSLVFVASLVGLAKRRHDLASILKNLEGNVFPLVMDSPVSDLSDRFTRGVIRWLPQIAPQIAIFLTSKNYRGPAEDELAISKRVGKRYLLAYHGPSKDKDADAQITINGQTMQQYFQEETEYTEIREVVQ